MEEHKKESRQEKERKTNKLFQIIKSHERE